jgi:EmrB/QacA subfamily drug resistance transporter
MPQRRWLVFAVLGAVAFMAQLDLFVVNVALPAMAGSFGGASLSSLSWVLNAYSIVLAALLVPAGRLADQFGRRRFLLAGTAVFTVASAVCSVAPGLAVIVAGRALQGAGAAMIVPTSLGLLFPAFPTRQHNLVVGMWAGVAAVAGSAGPTVGGLLVAVDWRLIFLINLPIGVGIVVCGLRVLPAVRSAEHARTPDAASAVALFAAVALVTFAMVQSTQWGWGAPGTLLLFAGASAAGAVAVRRTLIVPNAVIEAALFRSREFAAACGALFLFFLAFGSWLLLTVLFLQGAWGYDAVRTGLAILPGPSTAAVFALNSGRISGRFGRRLPAVVGPLLFAVGAAYWLFAARLHPDYAVAMLPGMVVAGSGAGLTQAPLFAAATTLPADRATTGSAVLNMARQLGSAIGVAVLVTLLAGAPAGTLAGFRRGWLLIIACCLAASAASALPRRARPMS